MATVVSFTFNPFQENTYLVYDDSGECAVFDPGCLEKHEQQTLQQFIEKNNLRPVRLINTHCHIDHIFGNRFIADTYGLELEIHPGELPVLHRAREVSDFYGVPYPEPSPEPTRFLQPGEVVSFGNTALQALFTPGHSPASLCFFSESDRFVIAGDVLFFQSIGRTDLPGGNYDVLIDSIETQLLPLGDEVKVYPGHGPATFIGYEKTHNPFLAG